MSENDATGAAPDGRVCQHAQWAELRACYAADMRRQMNKTPENAAAGDSVRTRLGAFFTPSLQCMLLYRLSHLLHVRGWRRLGACVAWLNALLWRADITPASCVGRGWFIPHPAGVVFHGRGGAGLTQYTQSVCCSRQDFSIDAAAGPLLGDGVSIGAAAVVHGPVRIGNNCKVGPRAHVDRDTPADSMIITRSMKPRIYRDQNGDPV